MGDPTEIWPPEIWRRYVRVLLGAVVGGTIAILGVNLAVDPANHLNDGAREKAIAAALENGRHVAGSLDIDGPALQRARIAMMSAPPETIVIGSSRAMQVRGKMLPGKAVNHAVSGATLGHFCAVADAYRRRDMTAARVVLIPDPWLFHAQGRAPEDTPTDPACRALFDPSAAPEDVQGSALAAVADMVSYATLTESLKRLRDSGFGALSPHWRRLDDRARPVDVPPSETGGWLSDGSALYPAAQRDPTAAALEAAAIAFARPPVYKLNGFDGPSPAHLATFARLIDLLTADGARVALVLAPYHPTAAALMAGRSPLGPGIAATEARLRDLAAERRLPLAGGYFSDACPPAWFHDGMHPTEACMAKLIDGLGQ